MAGSSRGKTPLYQEIASALRARIADGTLPPGARLPTEHELAEEFSTTRSTVRQGLQLLVNEGLVVAERPRGHFVRERRPMVYRPQQEFRPRPRTPEMDAFLSALAEEGRVGSQEIEVAIVQAPAAVKQRLRLAEDDMVAVRRRLRRIDGEPYNTNDSYFPLGLVDGTEIMNPTDIARGANLVLTELGYDQVRAIDEWDIRMPTPEEVRRLQIPPGTPVGCHTVTGYTAAGRPVRVVLNCLPGDRHKIVYERARNGADQDPPTASVGGASSE